MIEREYSFIQYNGYNFDELEEFLDNHCIDGITYHIKNNDYVGKYTNITYPLIIEYPKGHKEYDPEGDFSLNPVRVTDYITFSKTKKSFHIFSKDDFHHHSIELIHLNMKPSNIEMNTKCTPLSMFDCLQMIRKGCEPSYPCYSDGDKIRYAQRNIRKAFIEFDKEYERMHPKETVTV